MVRVLICGGRQYTNKFVIDRTLRNFVAEHNVEFVIHGDAKGADRTAGAIAEKMGLKVIKFPANWDELGPKAGPVRNARMLREGKPTFVIAFPGGNGTADMIKQANDAGVPVHVIEDKYSVYK